MTIANPIVTVTRRLPDPVEAVLTERFEARLNGQDHPLDRAALVAAMRDSDILLPTRGKAITSSGSTDRYR